MNLYNLDIAFNNTPQKSTNEVDFWIHHLEEIKQELKQFCAKKKYNNQDLIKSAVLLKASTNNSILKAIQNYKEFRDYWSKCEGFNSETPFIYEHSKHKSDYLRHIKEYRLFRSKLTKK
ncbi:hypothetical protein ACFFVB_11335 [Formosa undariae]|uniref:PIR Superfamily Protein n=1 Tax=Formosa undariae TaxID=1325436 RepID=A0ABV5F2K6_9FLAO